MRCKCKLNIPQKVWSRKRLSCQAAADGLSEIGCADVPVNILAIQNINNVHYEKYTLQNMNNGVPRYKEPADWLELWSFPQLIAMCSVVPQPNS